MAPKPASKMTMEEIQKKRGKRTFRVYTYRGIELNKLLTMSINDLGNIGTSRMRRRFKRDQIFKNPKYTSFLTRLRKAKNKTPAAEKPEMVRTHLRDMIIIPEMIGSVVGVYNGKLFTMVEIKPPMIGHYLGEFSITYKPVKHGKPGIGATHSSRFIPLK